MKKNEDGSVLLTKREFAELNKAYQALYDTLVDMPAYMGDFIEHTTHVAVCKWHEQLQGNKFVKEDWFE